MADGEFQRRAQDVFDEHITASLVLLCCLPQERQGMLAFASGPPAGARFHARRTVEQDDDSLRGAARRRAEPAADERPRHGPDQEEQDEHAAREEEILANLGAPRG